MRTFVTLLFLVSFAKADSCLIFATAPSPTGIATWSRAGFNQRHELVWLAGDYPEGFSFRSRIKDKDVDKLKAKGARVRVLDSQYTRDDLDKAKKECTDTK